MMNLTSTRFLSPSYIVIFLLPSLGRKERTSISFDVTINKRETVIVET